MALQNPGGNLVYNLPRLFEIAGDLDAERLRGAFARVIHRHQALRTTIRRGQNELVQSISPPVPFELGQTRLEPEEIETWIRRQAAISPDLESGPLFRAHLASIGKRSLLLMVWHHIVCDARSAEILDEELSSLYRGVEPQPVDLHFGDFAEWEGATSCNDARARRFWKEFLEGAPPSIELAFDRPRPAARDFRGAIEDSQLDDALARQLREFAFRHQVTPFPVFLAAFSILLSRYSSQRDLVVGVPVSQRDQPELDRVIGYFVNLLPLRLNVRPDQSFSDFARDCGSRYADCSQHALPFDAIIEVARPERIPGLSPLIQVSLNYLRETASRLQLGDAVARRLPCHNGTSMFDLTLTVSDRSDQFHLSLEYSTALFERSTVRQLGAHLCQILDEATSGDGIGSGEIRMLTDAERQTALYLRNATDMPVAHQETVLTGFDRCTAQWPDKTAIRSGPVQSTYAELQAYAGRVAAALCTHGIRPGDVVALHADRTPQTVASILGIWKCGAVYLPIDPRWPAPRAQFVMEDSAARLLLDDAWRNDFLSSQAPHAAIAVSHDSIAYLLYTSGSTGQPKGVPVCHGSLLNLLNSMRSQPGFLSEDTLLSVTPFNFDISLNELFLPLTSGGTILLPGLDQVMDMRALRALLEESPVTVLQATPVTWRSLISAGWQGTPGLRAWCGGETMPPELAAAILSRAGELWNLYGPTETTIWSTAHRVQQGEAPVPIGTPVANTQCYVLDIELRPLPDGVPGELFIGGAGVSPGYVGHAQSQLQRFLPDPFRPGSSMFRTGDRAKWTREGRLIFLNRLDSQVKVRGHRIEIAEVEILLGRLEGVHQAVAAVRDGKLTGWIVPVEGRTLDAAVLRRTLRSQAPGYLIPGSFVVLDHLPVNSNGKIDRAALPSPAAGAANPTDDWELLDLRHYRLHKIWEALLGRSDFDSEDDFFDLGGDSLLATELIHRLEEEFGKRLPVGTLFESPTIAKLDALLQQDGSPMQGELWAIQAAGSLPPFLCVESSFFMRDLGRRLGANRPFLSLCVPDQPQLPQPLRLTDAAASLVRSIRRVQPQGPFFLGGWCTSGVLAYETASQLREAGLDVPLLVLFDSYNPAAYGGFQYLINRFQHHLSKARGLPARHSLRYLRSRVTGLLSQAADMARRSGKDLTQPLRIGSVACTAQEQMISAVEAYQPPPYDGRVVLFRCADRPGKHRPDTASGWNHVTKKLEVIEIPGGHLTMFTEPNVETLAARMRELLEPIP